MSDLIWHWQSATQTVRAAILALVVVLAGAFVIWTSNLSFSGCAEVRREAFEVSKRAPALEWHFDKIRPGECVHVG